jgi:integrase
MGRFDVPDTEHRWATGPASLRSGPEVGKARTVAFPASPVPEVEPLVGGRLADEFVFTTARGKTLRAGNRRSREFNTAVADSGLNVEGLTPHKLRHTAVSLAIAAGRDVKVMRGTVGHADAGMTLNVYGHPRSR